MVAKTIKKAKATSPKKIIAKAKAPVKQLEEVKTPKAKSSSAKIAKKTLEAPITKKTTAATEGVLSVSKQNLIEKFAQKKGDTGSPEVQVALATQKIYNLTSHLDENPKDNHSRRGLLKIIAKRRRILHYLQGKDDERYIALVKNLGMKK